MSERMGDYLLKMRLGQGGMGSVYLAEDPRGQLVALKVLDERLALDDSAVKRFSKECEVLRSLDHPNIVQAKGPLEGAGMHHFYAMEYVVGRTVRQLLLAQGRLAPDRALEIASQALEGLEAAHAQGILHRDMKGTNLLVDRTGQVKICDFGLARAVDSTRLTASGTTLGTPATMSPEQALGEEAVPQSDLYSLGCVLYEMLTGRLPFAAEAPLAMMRMHVDDPPQPPSAHRPELAKQLDAFVLKALAKEPRDRFKSAAAMRTKIEKLRGDLAGAGEVVTPRELLSTAVVRLIEETQGALPVEEPSLVTPPPSRVATVAPLVAFFLLVVGLSLVTTRLLLSSGEEPQPVATAPQVKTERPAPRRVGKTVVEPPLEAPVKTLAPPPEKTIAPKQKPVNKKRSTRRGKRRGRRGRGRRRPRKRPKKKPKPKQKPGVELLLRDGTQVTGTTLSLKDNAFVVKQASGSEVLVPRELVVRIKHH